eukprot:CAMPEP_0172311128 /NCGR_PEP_ID=MMETSP1058-20130122/13823_1 /TAXON_ID=83371 /ORGANISM="Detonula confervacea, Strain CCMP 353" /LENGTH=235 /DNA_ID=CAMNT_0013024209 /DNA_START=20 /DNA_END=727 /DNA_ORIENTATION=+
MASEKTPLIPSGITPPSDASGDKPTVYFLERRDSNVSHHSVNHNNVTSNLDAEEIETIPEGSTVDNFNPRPVSVVGGSIAGGSTSSSSRHNGWLDFFKNVGKKSNAFASTGGATAVIDSFPRSAPVKIDPKVFFANERTFLAWMHVSVILAGASIAIGAFTDSDHSGPNQLYGVILLPVSISFILYAMTQYSRRASMIRRKAPGPYVDIVGPTVLTVILMLSIVAQFSVKLYTLM